MGNVVLPRYVLIREDILFPQHVVKLGPTKSIGLEAGLSRQIFISEDTCLPSTQNVGLEFTASHPVIRTNPVTGWRSLFGAAGQVRHGYIDEVTPRESEILKDYFLQTIVNNHDLQVRFRWNKNDLAIWDK